MTTEGFECYMNDLFINQAYCDVTIIVDDNDDDDKETPTGTVSIPAHRLVLATMSDYFRMMLYGQFIEANQSEIRLIGVPSSTFQQCLRFMYFGWDATLDNMTLDEGFKFYSLARMLLMDAKLKQSYSKWMAANVIKWEKQLWTIFTMAIENDLPLVVERCEELFSDVANEFIMSDAFLTVPLAVVRKVISCKKMNCSKKIQMNAIKRWITSNKTTDSVVKDLLNLVRSTKTRFKGKKLTLYHNCELKESKQQLLPDPVQHCYSSNIRFRRCIILVGVTVALERDRSSKQNNRVKKGVIDMKVEIKPSSASAPVLSKTAVVPYDLTKRITEEVAIFFPAIKICQESLGCTFTFSWSGEEAQPFLHSFGTSTSNRFGFTDASFVMSIYKTLASDLGHRNCDSCRYRNNNS